MGQLEGFATQTAMALSGTAPAAVQITPEVPGEAATPTTGPAEAPTAEPEVVTAPTNTPVPLPSATPGIPKNYTLKGGEFPFCIARRFDVDPGELLNLNGLGANSPSYAGMTLKIPQTGNTFPGNRALRSHPTTYTVASGDTLNSIACRFGDVDPAMIALANGIGENKRLSAGDELQIP
jgi:LysM repeat protein